MKNHEIEVWARRVVARIQAQLPLEDSLVELKARWPEPRHIARQLAGHANASAGAVILWLIGVDQKKGIVGVTNLEVGDWYNQVRAEFDDRVAPALLGHPVFDVDDKSVVPLAFSTDRPPYVVQNPERDTPKSGPFSLDVPWREGTNTRSANRSDLLRILLPQARSPLLEVLGCEVWASNNNDRRREEVRWTASASIYVTPRGSDRLVVPFHRCHARIQFTHEFTAVEFESLQFHPPRIVSSRLGAQNLSSTIESTRDEILIDGPGKIVFEATHYLPVIDPRPDSDCELHLRMLSADGEVAFGITASMPLVEVDLEKGRSHWKMGSA